VGVVFREGVVLGADTRATNGPIVAEKNCAKIHYLAPNMYCGGAGTAADTEFTTLMVSSNLELHRMNGGREARVVTALTMLKQHLFRHQGYVQAALILGGVDIAGSHLHTIHPHGSTDSLPFVTMGSGSLAAMSVFESGWKAGMDRDEAVDLVVRAVEAGIFNDLGSGSNVDVTIVTRGGAEVRRNYRRPAQRQSRLRTYRFPPGSTAVISETVRSVPRPGEPAEAAEPATVSMDLA
jgi:20S proteasome subunit beta 2